MPLIFSLNKMVFYHLLSVCVCARPRCCVCALANNRSLHIKYTALCSAFDELKLKECLQSS